MTAKASLLDRMGIEKDPVNLVRKDKQEFPEDKPFYSEEGNIGRVISKMDKIKEIKKVVDHEGFNFHAPLYYVPSDKKTNIKDCYAITKDMMDLWEHIEKTVKDPNLKNFFRIRFAQMIEIDFKRTADFYVNTTDEIKEIFEKLNLVVVDYEKAILNGFFDIANAINDQGEVCINGSYYQKKNEHMLKKNQNNIESEELMEDVFDEVEDAEAE